MKKIIKPLLLTFAIFGFSSLKAIDSEIIKHNGYLSVGGVSKATNWQQDSYSNPVIPKQNVSVQSGYRYQKNYLGYDIGLSGIISETVPITAHGKMLFFPKPSLKTQFYTGAGMSAQRLFRSKFSESFGTKYRTELALGTNYIGLGKIENFVQLNLSTPVEFPFEKGNRINFLGKNSNITMNYGILF